MNTKVALVLPLWHILAGYSYQAVAQNSIAEAVVQYFSPCQLVLFSKRMNGHLPQLALKTMSHAAMSECPLESLENSLLFRKAHCTFKHRQTCVVYLTFHPNPGELTADKVDLLHPFFDMIVDSLSLPEDKPGSLEGGRDLMVSLVDLSISPWSPGVEKYFSERHVRYMCMFSSAIILEYELSCRNYRVGKWPAEHKCQSCETPRKIATSYCTERGKTGNEGAMRVIALTVWQP